MTEIVNQSMLQSNIVAEKRMQQQRLEDFHYEQKRIQEQLDMRDSRMILRNSSEITMS